MTEVEHRIEVTSSFLGEGYTAHCSCGWISDECPDEEVALFYAGEHRTDLGEQAAAVRGEAMQTTKGKAS